MIAEHAFDYLDAPIKRVCGKDTPIPFSPILERFVVPQVSDIVSDSQFGQDALNKAKVVLERAKLAISQRNLRQIIDAGETLSRTLYLFRSVVQKASERS